MQMKLTAFLRELEMSFKYVKWILTVNIYNANDFSI